MDERDADRLLLLDRLAERVPGLDLDRHETEWTTLPDDDRETLLIDGGGIDPCGHYELKGLAEDPIVKTAAEQARNN